MPGYFWDRKQLIITGTNDSIKPTPNPCKSYTKTSNPSSCEVWHAKQVARWNASRESQQVVSWSQAAEALVVHQAFSIWIPASGSHRCQLQSLMENATPANSSQLNNVIAVEKAKSSQQQYGDCQLLGSNGMLKLLHSNNLTTANCWAAAAFEVASQQQYGDCQLLGSNGMVKLLHSNNLTTANCWAATAFEVASQQQYGDCQLLGSNGMLKLLHSNNLTTANCWAAMACWSCFTATTSRLPIAGQQQPLKLLHSNNMVTANCWAATACWSCFTATTSRLPIAGQQWHLEKNCFWSPWFLAACQHVALNSRLQLRTNPGWCTCTVSNPACTALLLSGKGSLPTAKNPRKANAWIFLR